MAKTKAIYSQDATTLIFKGDPKSPESSTGIIKFPGGHVEVSRTSDNKYWAHICVDETAKVTNSRLMYHPEAVAFGNVYDIDLYEHINQMAILIDGPFIQAGD